MLARKTPHLRRCASAMRLRPASIYGPVTLDGHICRCPGHVRYYADSTIRM
jgi:hypothetical protein